MTNVISFIISSVGRVLTGGTFVAVATKMNKTEDIANAILAALFASTIMIVISFLNMWLAIINDIRRLHDLNKSGVWCFVYFSPLFLLIIEVIAMVAAKDLSHWGILVLTLLLCGVGAIWRIIELGFISGTDSANDFGHPSGLGGGPDLGGEIAAMRSAAGYATADDPVINYASKAPQQIRVVT